MANKEQPRSTDEGKTAIFRIPGTSLLVILFLVICMTPLATTVPGLWALYVVPVGLVMWVLRMRTVATAAGLTVRTVFHKRDVPWDALQGFELTNRSRVVAVLVDDNKISLPAVRTRHLPVLALVSEGRMDDPSGLVVETPESTEDGSGPVKPQSISEQRTDPTASLSAKPTTDAETSPESEARPEGQEASEDAKNG